MDSLEVETIVNNLTNEQLSKFVRLVLQKAALRGIIVAAVFKNEEPFHILDESELAWIRADVQSQAMTKARREAIIKARYKAEADLRDQQQRQAAEKQALIWSKKKAIECALREWGLKEWKIQTWVRANDKRIYAEVEGANICLYVTGNQYNACNRLTLEKERSLRQDSPLLAPEGKVQFRNFLLEIDKYWNVLKLSNTDFDGTELVAHPEHLTVYQKALDLKPSS